MNFWFIVLSLLGLGGLAGLVYLVTRFRKFGFMQKIASKSRLLSWLLACAFVALFFLFGLINVYSIVVVVLHLTAFWIICDIAAAIVGKHRGKRSERYIAGIVTLAITTVYMTGAWIAAHHVWETDYTIASDKVDSPPEDRADCGLSSGDHFRRRGFRRRNGKSTGHEPGCRGNRWGLCR